MSFSANLRTRQVAWATFPLLALSWSTNCRAEGGATPPANTVTLIDQAAQSSSTFNFSYGPPSSPAVDLLGISSTKVSPSSSLAPFLLSVPSTLSGTGGQYAGIDLSLLAIENLFSSNASKLSHSQDSFAHFLSRTRLDFGITNGSSNANQAKAQPSGIAIGISSNLLESDDPLSVSVSEGGTYFNTCLAPQRDAEVKYQIALDAKYPSILSDDQASIIEYAQISTDPVEFKRRLDALENKYAAFNPDTLPKPTPLNADLAIFPDPIYGNLALEYKNVLSRLSAASTASSSVRNKVAASEAQALGFPAAVANCAKGAAVIASTRRDLSIGLGVRDSGEAGKLAGLNSVGGSVWLAGRIPIGPVFIKSKDGNSKLRDFDGNNSQIFDAINSGNISFASLGGSIRYDRRTRFLTGNTTTPIMTADELTAWLGLEWNASWIRIGGQGGYSRVRADQHVDAVFNQSGARWLADADVKIGSTGAWVGVTYGTASGTTAQLHDKTLLINLYFSPPSALSLLGS